MTADSLIDRVRAADAEAEAHYIRARLTARDPAVDSDQRVALGLIAIAAELRAQRIARRPGAGQ